MTEPGTRAAGVAADAHYLSLATFRRDGREVRTPVWFVVLDGRYCCFSAAGAGKVKRIRREPRARIAACDWRGRVHGPWHEVHAALVADAAGRARVYAALRGKYGWQMQLTDVLARASGRYHQRAVITLAAPA